MSDPLISSRIKTDDILSLFWSFSSSFKTAKSVRIDRDLISSPVCDNLRHLCHGIPFLVIFWSQLDRIHWISKIKISILSHSWLIKHIRHIFSNKFCTNENVKKKPIWKWIKNWTACWSHLLHTLKVEKHISPDCSVIGAWMESMVHLDKLREAQVAPRPFL